MAEETTKIESGEEGQQQPVAETPTPETSETPEASSDDGEFDPTDISGESELPKNWESIKFEDFQGSREPVEEKKEKVEEGKTTTEKVEDEKTEVEKTEVEKDKPTPTSEPSKTPTPVQSRAEVLKTLGVPDNEIPFYKGIPNENFNHVKGKLQELNDLRTKYAEAQKTLEAGKQVLNAPHPEGYLLDPQFKQLSHAANLSNSVVNHWIEQLEKAERGEEWQNLSADDKGNIRVSNTAMEPSEQAKSFIRKELREAEMYALDFNKQVRDQQANYKTKYEGDLQMIKSAEEKYFPDYDKPDHPTSAIQKAVIEKLPPSFRNLPTTSLLAKTVANNSIFKQKLEDATKENVTLKAEIAQLKASRPSNPQQPTKSKFQQTPVSKSSRSSYDGISFEQFDGAFSR